MSYFRITGNKGFHISFASGWTVSVQFGPGNYGDNYENPAQDAEFCGKIGSTVTEVWCWKDGERKEYFPPDPLGYQTADQVAAIIACAAAGDFSSLELPK